MKSMRSVLAALLLCSAGFAQEALRTAAPGRVGLVLEEGVWYLRSPEGKPFLSRGICVVQERDGSVKPGSRGYDGLKAAGSADAWAEGVADSMRSWNFDTVANWSSPSMRGRGLYTVESLNVRIERGGRMRDVFSPAFERDAADAANRICAPRRDDAMLIGYFLENEQPWYGDYGWYTGHAPTLLDSYMDMPAASEGKKALVAFFRGAYAGISAFNEAYGTRYRSWEAFAKAKGFDSPSKAVNADREAFAGVVAERYYSVLARVIRARDPGHLILGDRFANHAPREVVKACGRHCDVLSLNYYLGYEAVSPEYLKGFAELSGRPLLITEFSYRATENRSGDRNTKGADVTVETQRDRAEGYRRYVSSLARLPFVVGWHWFQFFDESPGGRSFDGEDSNYGVVDIDGRPYEELVAAMRETNALAPGIHAASASTVIGEAVFMGDPVAVRRGAERAKKALRLYPEHPRAFGWADESNGGKIKVSASGGVVRADYSSGTGWGCGFSIEAEGGGGKPYADLSAFEGLEISVRGPAGLKLAVFVSESGVAEPGKTSYLGSEGADGESFSSDAFTLPGGRTRLRLPFEFFSLRGSYGNQSGNRCIDLQAIKTIEVYISGGQGEGKLEILSFNAY